MIHLTPTFAILTTLFGATQLAHAQNLFTPASSSGTLTGLKYTHVGTTGSYNQVTNMIPGTFPTCDANPACITQPKQISGASPVFRRGLHRVCVMVADVLCPLLPPYLRADICDHRTHPVSTLMRIRRADLQGT